MNVNMQSSVFTHGKCPSCNHLALIDKFDQQKKDHVKKENEDGSSMEMYLTVLTCPICGYGQCEALFPNEVN